MESSEAMPNYFHHVLFMANVCVWVIINAHNNRTESIIIILSYDQCVEPEVLTLTCSD